MKKLQLLLLILLCRQQPHAQDIVLHTPAAGAFPLVTSAGATAIYVDTNDHWLVQQAAVLLRQDIQRVTGRSPVILHKMPASAASLIIIGSLDHNPAITPVINDSLRGKWEAFTLTTTTHPLKGIGQALVITGSDRRGTAYGVFELSGQIGVSPWYWWADVPVTPQKELYIRKDTWVCQHPAVKYRGFFINDEAPCLSGWTKEKFGGFNHLFYEKVFELLLRMKANYLWPAMWGNAFNDDDTLNPILADKYGIVMGTSHHEPMLRAQQEWKRYGSGPWNYETNAAVLDSFWEKGIRNMDSHESIVTIGMRGDGDMPMTEGSNIALLEKIVGNQRKIIEDVTGKAPTAIPQSWALYKEVQDYYDKGMRVPDDVTLLLCDDNWGNVRKLPAINDKPRSGGYGMYYHFDYVGDPRNYKWLNTNSLPRVWEQMHLTKQYGVDHIWIVNVGDIKPMELPIEFFLDYAWAPDKYPADSLDAYVLHWAARQFGGKYAAAIADILKKYTFYNSRRKPELLAPDTYSLLHYNEAQQVVSDYNALAHKADAVYNLLPPALHDAYYQLVLYPVKACANLNELYYTVGLNHLYAAQGRYSTTQMAEKARTLYLRDSLLSKYYNDTLAGGKWRHMMDQTHIGYTYWQQPPFNSMPSVFPTPARDTPSWDIAIGDTASLSQKNNPQLIFRRYGEDHWIDIFSRKPDALRYTTTGGAPWLRINPEKEQQLSHQQARLQLSIDWQQVPSAGAKTRLIITGPDGQHKILTIIALAPSLYDKAPTNTFLESDGYISMEAEHYTRDIHTSAVAWQRIPGLGRTLSGMEAMPVTSPAQTPGSNSPRLEYDMYLTDTGAITIHTYFSPTLNFSGKGLRYAVSIDSSTPQIIDLAENSAGKKWNLSVADNIFISSSSHVLSRPGKHVLKYWMVDPGVVLQKIVVDAGGVKPSYLGPPESHITPPPDSTSEGLKDYYKDLFPMGVAVSPRSIAGPDSILIIHEFNSLTPENAMKMGPIHPEEHRYDWKDADAIVDFAIRHGMKVRGHTLCWHEQTPAWLFKDATGKQVTKDILLQRLKAHITAVVSRYKGKIYAWDVVNEAIDDDSSRFLRNSPWLQICGDEFIKKAFEWAHQADPDAQLFYNDYNTERGEKRERVYRLLKQLVDAGVPITGVGLQGHWSIYEPSEKQLKDAILRFSSLGLKVQITELDISIYPWEKFKRDRRPGETDAFTPELEQQQITQYEKVFSIFRKTPITGVTFWNVTDKHTWLDNYPVPGRKNYPLLFDTAGHPKKAYWKVTQFQ